MEYCFMSVENDIDLRFLVTSTLVDDINKDEYHLQEVIGTDCLLGGWVFKALVNYRSQASSSPQYRSLKAIDLKYSGEQMIKLNKWRNDELPVGQLVEIEAVFIDKGLFCMSMPYMEMGSLRYLMGLHHPQGLPEESIAAVLREVIGGLSMIHTSNSVHKKVSAGSIFLQENDVGGIKAKLGVDPTLYNHNPYCSSNIVVSNWPDLYSDEFWPINKVYEAFEMYDDTSNITGYSQKTDILLMGITALELAYGNILVRHNSQLDFIYAAITKTNSLFHPLEMAAVSEHPQTLGVWNIIKEEMKWLKKRIFSQTCKHFSLEFQDLVLKCIHKNPKKRPTAADLLTHPFINKHAHMLS